jgi:hypothetical protein
MNTIRPAAGNRTIVTMAKIAKQHDLKMIIPATIWLCRDRNAFLYSDIRSGLIKIQENQIIDTNVLNRFISERMTPAIDPNLKD